MSAAAADIDEGFRSSDGVGAPDVSARRSNGPAAADESSDGPSADGSASRSQSAAKPEDAEITTPPQLGDKDANGYMIDTIYWSTKQFVIYQADGQIRYTLPNDYQVAKALRVRVADLGGLRASIEDLRGEPCLSQNEKARAARETAWALALGFEDDAETPSSQPKDILTKVDARLRSLLKSHYRKRYAISNFVAFVAIEAVLFLITLLTSYFPGSGPVLPRYSTYCMFGALGAFLSVITSIRSIDINLDLKAWEHIFAGATRILIGVIGALVIGLALDSSFLDPMFGSKADPATDASTQLDKRLAMYLIFSFIAGFSESLVPNILRRGEQSAGDDKSSTPDDAIVKEMKP
jgi:hypothetical protein